MFNNKTYTHQYLLFNSHHPLEHKLGAIKSLQQRGQRSPHHNPKEEETTARSQNMWFPRLGLHKNQTPAKKRREINIIAFLSPTCLKFMKNSGESSENMTFQHGSNPLTHSDKNWSTQSTRHQYANKVMLSMPSSARRNARTVHWGN